MPETITKLQNPYADEVWKHGVNTSGDYRFSLESLRDIHFRDQMLYKYAYAIPNSQAIEAMVGYEKPIVEMGAGKGYWAWLLSQAGAKVKCFDLYPPDACVNGYFPKEIRDTGEKLEHKLYYPIEKCESMEVLKAYKDSALLLCWPPYANEMATEAAQTWEGDLLFYVGESANGCTGSHSFHDLLETGFDEIGDVDIPQWPYIHDRLYIYRRKNTK